MEFILTWFMMLMNCPSLLSSTKFSHTMSRIQLNGFDGQVFKSSAAPPVCLVSEMIVFRETG